MPKKLTIEEFISGAKLVHDNKYDYSKSIYKGSYNEIKIICSIHGIFDQIAHDHLRGCGCPSCAKNTLLDISEFINRSEKFHGNKYNYSKFIYKNSKTKSIIICPIHGEFYQNPQHHLYYGCPKCAPKTRHQNIPKTTSQFIKDAIKVHGNMWDYSKTMYIDAKSKLGIWCRHHGEFKQSPNKHLFGQGCPECQHIISTPERKFLEYCNISLIERQKYISPYKVDGIKGNKIYEFLGDYWHGNPIKYDKTDHNQQAHKTFGELYQKTVEKFINLKSRGYDIYYIWENDWNMWVKNNSLIFPIKKYNLNRKSI